MFGFLLKNGLFRCFSCLSTRLGNLRDFKVTMIVVATPRIELPATNRAARFALHVLQNRQYCTARAAKYRLLVPFALGPDCNRMIGERLVAILAGIVKAATFHLDSDDVRWPVIMLATSL
jgi:hypothetical protein